MVTLRKNIYIYIYVFYYYIFSLSHCTTCRGGEDDEDVDTVSLSRQSEINEGQIMKSRILEEFQKRKV